MAGIRISTQVFGVVELRDALKQLPPQLAAEARDAVIATTQATASELRAVYPQGDTGNLRRGVKVKITNGPALTTGRVNSTAPHAKLWEYGTVNRKTEKGWNRGRMPSQISRGLYAIATRRRRALQRTILDIIERAGFTVKAA